MLWYGTLYGHYLEAHYHEAADSSPAADILSQRATFTAQQ